MNLNAQGNVDNTLIQRLHYESADSPHVAWLIKADFQSESAVVKPDTVGRLYGNGARLQRHQRNRESGESAAETAHFQTQQGLNIGLTHRC